jgi:enoyl-CoA hydratase/carnithine racemase
MTEEPAVLYASDGRIATLTLNRPENRNSMTPDLLEAFAQSVRRAREERSLRAVILTGSGRSFCAGADFRATRAPRGAAGDARLAHETMLETYAPFLSLLDVEVPVIGALTGHAIGGGFGLALLCDLRVANREARYGANFARIGLHTGMAVSYLLPRLVGLPTAVDLLFSGRLVTGEEAARIGLVHAAVDASEVVAEAQRRAEAIAACAPVAVRLIKRSLYRGLGWDPRGAAEAEAWAQAATFATEDVREGIRALLEKRDPRFEGR